MSASSRSGLVARKTAEPAGKARRGAAGERPASRTGLTSLNRLRCFEVVVEESGFKRATARLHITQPALSYQMKHLEGELGAQLFVRRPGGVTLTEAGRLLYAHVQRVSAAVRSAEQAVRELPAVGEVRIGTVNSIGTYFLPDVLAAMHERHAETTPSLYRSRSDDTVEALLANHVDLAILADPRLDKRLRYETLFTEHVSLVAGRAHPLFGAPRLDRALLEQAPLVALSPKTPTGALVQKHLERLGIRLEPVVSTEDVLTVKRMVEMGIGAAFLPDMVTRRDVAGPAHPDGRLWRIDLTPPLVREIVLVTWDGAPSSRAVAVMIEEVRRLAAAWSGGAAPARR